MINLKIDFINNCVEFNIEDYKHYIYKNKILESGYKNVLDIQKDLINLNFNKQIL